MFHILFKTRPILDILLLVHLLTRPTHLQLPHSLLAALGMLIMLLQK